MFVDALGHLVIAVLALAVLSRVLGAMFAKWGLPDLLGGIAAGVLLGPQVLGVIDLRETGFASDAISLIAAGGLSMLMLIGGMSMPTGNSSVSSRTVAVLFLVSMAALGVALATSSFFPPPIGQGGTSLVTPYHLVLALAVIVTSVPFLTNIFLRNGLLATSLAQTTLQVACAIDIIIWSIYPVVAATNDGTKTVDLFVVIQPSLSVIWFLFCIHVAAVIIARVRGEVVTNNLRGDLLAAGCLGLVALVTASLLDVHIMAASFFYGYMARKVCNAERVLRGGLALLAGTFVIPVYFGSIGASMASSSSFDLTFVFWFGLWSFCIKGAAIYIGARMLRYDQHMSLLLSVVLNTRGGPGIALAAVAFGDLLIDEKTFVAFVVMALATTVATQFVLRRSGTLILAK